MPTEVRYPSFSVYSLDLRSWNPAPSQAFIPHSASIGSAASPISWQIPADFCPIADKITVTEGPSKQQSVVCQILPSRSKASRGSSLASSQLATKPRSVLTSEQAIKIFKAKPPGYPERGSSSVVAREFNISPKTVRDIWSGRTWFKEILPLDALRQTMVARLERRPGRPKGAKDRKPRRKHQACEDLGSFPPQSLHPSDQGKPCNKFTLHAEVSFALLPTNDKKILHRSNDKHQFHEPMHSELFVVASVPSMTAGTDSELNVNKKSWKHDVEDIAMKGSDCCDPFHDDWPFWNDDVNAEAQDDLNTDLLCMFDPQEARSGPTNHG